MSLVNVLSLCVCASLLLIFEDGIWDVIIFIPDRYLPIYFKYFFLDPNPRH